MREYLAKPNETIEQHTQKLIDLYNEFMLLYGEHFTQKEKDVILYVCKMHDLGKQNYHFQKKIKEGNWQIEGEYPHGVLSCAFIDRIKIKKELDDYYKIIYQAIYNHHTRNFDFTDNEINDYIENNLKPYLAEDFPDILLDSKCHCFGKLENMSQTDAHTVKYFLVKGMLNKFDYAASANIKENISPQGVEIAPYNPSNNVIGYIGSNFNSQLNDCQTYMKDSGDKNIIVVASTGSGKTEGSLLWAGKNKTFYTLPLKVSIDAIYERLYKNAYYDKNILGHIHSDTLNFFIKKENELGNNSAYDNAVLYQRRARAFVYPVTVCTVDQLFLFVFKAPGLEILPATLSYSKLIIDEIQSYSPNILAYIVYGLKLLTDMGTKFCIMTATLPPFLLKVMEELNLIDENCDIKYFYLNKNRHKIKICYDGDFDYGKILSSAKEKKVLVLCNTVNRAQEVYDKLKDSGIDKNNIHLLHNRYLKEHREEKENTVKKIGDKNNKCAGIVVSTQIVEASLDIDFDELHTDMCSADSLLQRLGRCYRSREYTLNEPNIYIADSKIGIGSVYDEDIYNSSLRYLAEYDGKIFTEYEKTQYMNNVYSLENIKNTKYYQSFIKLLNNIKNLRIGDYTKTESKYKFREIINIPVIPYIYNQNVIDIIPLLKSKNSKEKYDAYEILKRYSVSISYGSFSSLKQKVKGFEFTPVLDTDYYLTNLKYDAETGLKYICDEEALKEQNNML